MDPWTPMLIVLGWFATSLGCAVMGTLTYAVLATLWQLAPKHFDRSRIGDPGRRKDA